MTRRPGAGEDWIALVEKIIEGSPKLDGARCADYPGMFDARDVGERVRALILSAPSGTRTPNPLV